MSVIKDKEAFNTKYNGKKLSAVGPSKIELLILTQRLITSLG